MIHFDGFILHFVPIRTNRQKCSSHTHTHNEIRNNLANACAFRLNLVTNVYQIEHKSNFMNTFLRDVRCKNANNFNKKQKSYRGYGRSRRKQQQKNT